MARIASPFPIALPPRARGASAARWLYESLRAAILDGRLSVGARLPTTRELARQHGLARGTIVAAFESLKAEGYVEATVGSGTYVACELPESLLLAPPSLLRAAPGPRAAGRHARRLSKAARRFRPLAGYPEGPAPPFRVGQPALELFPTALWAQLASRRLRLASARLLLGTDALGYAPLREAIASYLTAARGVRCTAGQVAIVSGTLEALHRTARLLLDPGDRVAIESPGYGGAQATLEAAGARLVPVPVDDEGLVVDARRLRGARLVYVTPAHQFPMGVAMSMPRRLALLDWACRAGATVFEDDYDSEYRYCGPPMPALQGLDCRDNVLFAGSFAKVLFPALRLGYVVLPQDLVEPFAALISLTARHAPVVDQAVLADFIAGGHFGRHVRRMRGVYAERHAALLAAARDELAGLLEVCSIEAGLQTVGWLPEGVDGARVAERARARGLEVRPVVPSPGGPAARHVLLLGFAAVDGPAIRRGCRALAAAVREAMAGPARARAGGRLPAAAK